MQIQFTVDTVTKEAKVTMDGVEHLCKYFTYDKYSDEINVYFSKPEIENPDNSEVYISYRICGSEVTKSANKNGSKSVADFLNNVFSLKK